MYFCGVINQIGSMKKLLIFLLPLLWMGCSDSVDSPVIEVKGLYIESDNAAEANKNYADAMDELPVLSVGDFVKVNLLLDGNGSELKSFLLKSDENVDTQLYFEHTEVSDEENLTNPEHGQLRFSDGVDKARLMVKATVTAADSEGNAKLIFYLSSKAECDGAQEEIELKTGTY